MLRPHVKSNEKERGLVILLAEEDGYTIAIEGSVVELTAAIVHSIRKRYEFGELLIDAMRVNAMMALDNLKDSIKKEKNNGTEK